MSDPAVLFYSADFILGTAFFTMEERGQYITLLCEQHQNGPIPESHLVRVCGSLSSNVAEKFIRGEDGKYYNPRMKEETERRKKYCKSRKSNKTQTYVSTYVEPCVQHMETETKEVMLKKELREERKKEEFGIRVLRDGKMVDGKRYGLVCLAVGEYEKLLEKYGDRWVKAAIEKLDSFIPNSEAAKKYTDHNRVLRGWVKDSLSAAGINPAPPKKIIPQVVEPDDETIDVSKTISEALEKIGRAI
jgi:uncharacterized protein YdaU (DUF1376 family)